jgi:hypothetical protein
VIDSPIDSDEWQQEHIDSVDRSLRIRGRPGLLLRISTRRQAVASLSPPVWYARIINQSRINKEVLMILVRVVFQARQGKIKQLHEYILHSF